MGKTSLKNYPLMVVEQPGEKPVEQPTVIFSVEYEHVFIERADYLQDKLEELITFYVKPLANNKDDLDCLKSKFLSNIPLLTKDEIKEVKEFQRISDSAMEKYRPVIQLGIQDIGILSKIDIGEVSSLAMLFGKCAGISLIYRLLGLMLSRPLRIPLDFIGKIETASYVTLQKMGEYMGYWTAERKVSQRNTIGAKQKTMNKEKDIQDMISLMRKLSVDINDRDSRKKFIPKAMEHLKKGEKTIINYINSLLQPEATKITE